MNNEQEKASLWNSYFILMGIMLGGAIIVLGGQYIWNMKQQQGLFQSTQTPVVSPTASPSFSDTNSSQGSSDLQTSQSATSRKTAEQTLQDYYSAINSRQYQIAWQQLPPSLQNNAKVHPDGINSFIEWWEQVQLVEIKQIINSQTNTETAIIDTQIQYLMKSGKQIPQTLRFFFIWDASSEKWLINKVKLI